VSGGRYPGRGGHRLLENADGRRRMEVGRVINELSMEGDTCGPAVARLPPAADS